jgi:transposase
MPGAQRNQMTLDQTHIEKSVNRVKDLVATENKISPALKAAMDTLLLLATILMNRLGLTTTNLAKPPSSIKKPTQKQRSGRKRKPGKQSGE